MLEFSCIMLYLSYNVFLFLGDFFGVPLIKFYCGAYRGSLKRIKKKLMYRL